MPSRFSVRFLLLFLLLPSPLLAEQPILEKVSRPPALMQSAGPVFVGTVTAIKPTAPRGNNGVAIILITFHVDQAIRGVHGGQSLTIRQWAGLWEMGQQYKLGERVLLFLYPPSKLGLTSLVRGPIGRFPVGSDGTIAVAGQQSPELPPQVRARMVNSARIGVREFSRMLRLAGEKQP